MTRTRDDAASARLSRRRRLAGPARDDLRRAGVRPRPPIGPRPQSELAELFDDRDPGAPPACWSWPGGAAQPMAPVHAARSLSSRAGHHAWLRPHHRHDFSGVDRTGPGRGDLDRYGLLGGGLPRRLAPGSRLFCRKEPGPAFGRAADRHREALPVSRWKARTPHICPALFADFRPGGRRAVQPRGPRALRVRGDGGKRAEGGLAP